MKYSLENIKANSKIDSSKERYFLTNLSPKKINRTKIKLAKTMIFAFSDPNI